MSADGDNVRLVLDVSEEQDFGLLLYWDQVQGPLKTWKHKNLVRLLLQVHVHPVLMPVLRMPQTVKEDTPKAEGLGGERGGGLSAWFPQLWASPIPLPYLLLTSFRLLIPQTGPQTITLNHTDLVPCLCIQVGAESTCTRG